MCPWLVVVFLIDVGKDDVLVRVIIICFVEIAFLGISHIRLECMGLIYLYIHRRPAQALLLKTNLLFLHRILNSFGFSSPLAPRLFYYGFSLYMKWKQMVNFFFLPFYIIDFFWVLLIFFLSIFPFPYMPEWEKWFGK